jgi:transposase
MAYPRRQIELRRRDRSVLEGWLRTRTTEQRKVARASIVLGSSDGMSVGEIAREVGVSKLTVQRWLDRYEADGIKALSDLPRSGRKAEKDHAGG